MSHMISKVTVMCVLIIALLLMMHGPVEAMTDDMTDVETAQDISNGTTISFEVIHPKQMRGDVTYRIRRDISESAVKVKDFHLPDDYKVTTFEGYEKCTQARLGMYHKKHSYVEPIVVLFQEGQSVSITCHLCLRPDQNPNTYELKWMRRQKQKLNEELVYPNHRFVRDRFTLFIYGIRVIDAARYTCYKNDIAQVAFRVEVVAVEKRTIVWSGAKRGLKAAPIKAIAERNLQLVTVWTKWSKCNRCNVVGIRRRIGICTVKKLYQNDPVKPRNVVMLSYFRNGVPCRSTLLPPSIHSLKEIQDRTSETMLERCDEVCPSKIGLIWRLTLDMFKKKEVKLVQPGKMYVRYYNYKPTVAPRVFRRVMYKEVGTSLLIKCKRKPSWRGISVWQNFSRIIDADTIRILSDGRIRIRQVDDAIIFRDLQYYDAGLYGCWQDGIFRCSTQLFVTKRINMNLRDYVIMFGLAVALILKVLVGCGMFKTKHKGASRYKKR